MWGWCTVVLLGSSILWGVTRGYTLWFEVGLCGTLWLTNNILFDVGDEEAAENPTAGDKATVGGQPDVGGDSSGNPALGEMCGVGVLWFKWGSVIKCIVSVDKGGIYCGFKWGSMGHCG